MVCVIRQQPLPEPMSTKLCLYNDIIMSTMASQITSLTSVYSSVYSGAGQRKHQSSASLAFVRGIHWWPVNSPHKGPVTWKMFRFDDIMSQYGITNQQWLNQIMLKLWSTVKLKIVFTIESYLQFNNYEGIPWCYWSQDLMSLSWDLRKSHDSNYGRILGKLIPNSRSYTAITSCRASKL